MLERMPICGGILLFSIFLFSTQVQADNLFALPKTGQTTSYAPGDDGQMQTGVAWPTPRFRDNDNATVTDYLTGLTWAKDANIMATRDPGFDTDGLAGDGAVSWQHALDYVKKLNQENYLGYNDWQLPNKNELASLVDLRNRFVSEGLTSSGFSNVKDPYWSSTTYAFYKQSAWRLDTSGGYLSECNKPLDNYVWPVRNEMLSTPYVYLPETGQTECWDTSGSLTDCQSTGQDGETRTGMGWPTSRFTDNGNQTITDNLTGLVWTQNANLMATRNPDLDIDGTSGDGAVTWQQALTYIAKLNQEAYLGYSDWRVPNRNELASLINSQQSDLAIWLNSLGFANVQGYKNNQTSQYWSSSTFTYNSESAWIIDSSVGYVYAISKSQRFYFWPIRGGVNVPTTPVPVMEGWWFLPGMLAGVGLLSRRRRG